MSKLRVLYAPRDIAGQPSEWAKALRARSAFAYHAIKWGLVVLVIAGIWAI